MSSSGDREDQHVHGRRPVTSAAVREDGFPGEGINTEHRVQDDGAKNNNRGRHADPSAANDDERLAVAEPQTGAALSSDAKIARQTVVAREKEQFGGIKIGSAFFGWLTATGMAVLLTAMVAAAGTAVGLATNTDVNEAVNQAAGNETVGIIGI